MFDKLRNPRFFKYIAKQASKGHSRVTNGHPILSIKNSIVWLARHWSTQTRSEYYYDT